MVKDFSFSDFVKELSDSDNTGNVKNVETRKERQYFLIVTEGERTEPNYFNFFRDRLPNRFLSTIDVRGQGTNTINVVEKAIRGKEKRERSAKPDFDEVWAVFDKDDFPDHRVNEAISLAERNNINTAFSNQAFELWYILHFQDLDSNLHRSRYISILSNILGINYTKNSLDIVQKIMTQGDINLAIRRAEKLEKEHINSKKPPSSSAPYTTVHNLVKKLKEYCDL